MRRNIQIFFTCYHCLRANCMIDFHVKCTSFWINVTILGCFAVENVSGSDRYGKCNIYTMLYKTYMNLLNFLLFFERIFIFVQKQFISIFKLVSYKYKNNTHSLICYFIIYYFFKYPLSLFKFYFKFIHYLQMKIHY